MIRNRSREETTMPMLQRIELSPVIEHAVRNIFSEEIILLSFSEGGKRETICYKSLIA